MSRHLYAIHDFDPAWASMVRDAGMSGWCVSTHELGDDPANHNGHDFRDHASYNITPIARLNYSHHGQGTIPLPNRYNEFAARCANFVANSRGCNRWIIGNEANLAGERPGGATISPQQYARCFSLCRAAIKRVSPTHQVIVAAVAPYNIDSGPWIDYWREALKWIVEFGGADGLALHTYSRGSSPASIVSEEKMGDSRVSQYYNGFRAYKDFLAVVPASMRSLPVYITETDQNEPWADANTGWVQAAYAEIDRHNSTPGAQLIHCLTLYRWYQHDQWEFSSKRGVIDDFRAAVAKGYQSPDANVPARPSQPTEQPDNLFLPYLMNWGDNMPAPNLPRREWDERLTQRSIELTEYQPAPGETYMRLVKGEYWTEKEHTFVVTLGKDGQRQPGHTVRFWWGNGNHDQEQRKVTELKPNDRWMVDFPMFSAGRSYGVEVLGYPSDSVFGMGLGSVEQPDWNIHVSYKFTFQMVTVPKGSTQLQPSQPAQPPAPPTGKVPALAHPISDPARRIVSQRFGENPDAYARFNLAGHTGIDYAVPVGTPIGAVDSGVVLESQLDIDGYGEYIKIRHVWGESLYAHLRTRKVEAGEAVNRGSIIGTSGNTGNSTGPHLHFAMRVYPYKRGYPWDGFSDPAPYLISTPVQPAQPQPTDLLGLIKAAAQEFGIEWQLLASLAWAESSFDPAAVSGSGAMGLTQLMPPTWAEWSVKVGASDPFDPRDNLRVGAAYLAWLLKQTNGNTYKAAIAYVWGIGNVLSGRAVPNEAYDYSDKVVHGRDLLRAVGT